MKNYYIIARAKIILNLIKRRKITIKKLLNAFYCFFAYAFRLETSAKFPLLISFELGNECNANCLFCRDGKGAIFDQNPRGSGAIEKGQMPIKMYEDILSQAKDYILMATLYINGEPLMYKDIYRAIAFATNNNVPSMIATNGILLTESNSHKLLSSGIDFIKVAISGFTQDTYSREVRFGNVETIKANISNFVKLNRQGNYGAVIMVDYMLYNFNKHQLPQVQEFCKSEGVMLSVRPGNPLGLEGGEPPQNKGSQTINISCDWLYKTLSVNFDGDVMPCCDYVIWSNLDGYEKFKVGTSSIADIFNGKKVKEMRRIHKTKGRGAIEICKNCVRRGIAFKY